MNLKRKNILKLFVCANKTMFQSQTDVFTDIQCSFSDHKEPNNTSKHRKLQQVVVFYVDNGNLAM